MLYADHLATVSYVCILPLNKINPVYGYSNNEIIPFNNEGRMKVEWEK
jgi:hypothetical protein